MAQPNKVHRRADGINRQSPKNRDPYLPRQIDLTPIEQAALGQPVRVPALHPAGAIAWDPAPRTPLERVGQTVREIGSTGVLTVPQLEVPSVPQLDVGVGDEGQAADQVPMSALRCPH